MPKASKKRKVKGATVSNKSSYRSNNVADDKNIDYDENDCELKA